MDQTTLNYIVVGLSFALYFGIAIWARAGSTGEFYAAGRGVHHGHCGILSSGLGVDDGVCLPGQSTHETFPRTGATSSRENFVLEGVG